AADRHACGQIILLARGGGSLEDLWAFNDENLARAIAACHTPVISGVGHETDFTIADFVADQRAATPTAAAVAATPDGPELLVQLGRSRLRLTRAVEQTLQRQMQRLDHADKRLHQQHPRRRLDELTRRQTDLARRSTLAIKRQLDSHSRRLQGLESRLFARHPDRQLQRLE